MKVPYLLFLLGFETVFRTALRDCPLLLSLDKLPKLHTPILPHVPPPPQELASDPGFLTTMLCGLGGFSLLLGLASREQRLQRWTRPLSGLVWAALLALGLGFLFTGGVVSAWDQVRQAEQWGGDSRASDAHPGPEEQRSSVSVQLPAPVSPRCPFSFLSSSPCTPCCPWACGTPPPRVSPLHSHTCWSSGCILGFSRTHSPRCCRR